MKKWKAKVDLTEGLQQTEGKEVQHITEKKINKIK